MVLLAGCASSTATAVGRTLVIDVIFVLLSLAFFVVSIGYVAACDRLMK